jgi:hypothetical protein
MNSFRVLSRAFAIVLGSSSLLPTVAEAHVKWFCAYDIAGQPEGLGNVLCQDFELLTGFAIFVLLVGGLIDRTFVGEALVRSLDRVSAPVLANTELIMRATCGFFLICLWSIGGVIMTPELTTTSTVIPSVQLAMAACLLWRQTMPLAALGIVGLFVMGTVNYGLFHLMDYPVFLGIAAYLALTGLGREIPGLRNVDILRWSAAITLMWASVEKWAYPEWSYPLFIIHPGMAMGYDPAFFMRAAGVVEFTMSFALIWTPLVRRAASVMLIATFVSAIGAFGKIDAIGHAPIIAVLLAIFADQARERRGARRIVLMPLQYGGALATFIALYYVGHSLAFHGTLS